MIIKKKISQFVDRVKKLDGDPHHIAVGMSIGVFIGITPTFPFHTALAVMLAYILRASKAAAALGVWIGNPLTMPFFYFTSYKTGQLIFKTSLPFDLKYTSLTELIKLGSDATLALMTGGTLIGILPAILTYFITWHIAKKVHLRKKQREHIS
ncbi:DUF2062 domain-containing protein [Desulfobacterium sp. N47]|uniref:DUF2062 domain-containing protein n=1 Tax=uncultured Desulfobacterium sp. TaxID=201089 RepID=E1YFF3_9BACT|nr:hypothetical protein N47_J02780 [uncultured Desulfobacterium sp.]